MCRWTFALTLALSPTLLPAADPVPERDELLRKAAAVRPNATDFRWQQIPWHTEPADALKQAKAENRPLFVWLAGGRDRDGSPLERC
jgi:hypothetical protein